MRLKIAAVALVGLMGMSAASMAAEETLGQMLQAGQISQSAFDQLIVHSGVSAQKAKGMTLDQVTAKRWQNS